MNNALSSITRKVFTLTIVAALTSIKRAFVYIAFYLAFLSERDGDGF